jgi:hypothetical protein
LTKVIRALSTMGTDGEKASKAHIPYRESKLTRILQVRDCCRGTPQPFREVL